MSEETRPKTFLFFRRPLFKDWVFVVFAAFVAINFFDSFNRVMDSGGPKFTPADIASGTVDVGLTLLGCYVFALIFMGLRWLVEAMVRRRTKV